MCRMVDLMEKSINESNDICIDELKKKLDAWVNKRWDE